MDPIIEKYFSGRDGLFEQRMDALKAIYEEWNARINVISRKDTANFYLHHVLHSLAIAARHPFEEGCSVLDVGTGGGFPGIPLAVLRPDCRFTLCDSIGKKVRVVREVVSALGLTNVEAVQARVEDLPGKWDYVVSRAVTDLSNFYPWIRGKYTRGAICLKGGDVYQEAARCSRQCKGFPSSIEVTDIRDVFDEEWFEDKKVVFIPG